MPHGWLLGGIVFVLISSLAMALGYGAEALECWLARRRWCAGLRRRRTGRAAAASCAARRTVLSALADDRCAIGPKLFVLLALIVLVALLGGWGGGGGNKGGTDGRGERDGSAWYVMRQDQRLTGPYPSKLECEKHLLPQTVCREVRE